MNEQTEDDNNLKTRKRASAKMQNIGSYEFKKLHEKEALRKKEIYWKNKKKYSNELAVIKIKRKTRKTEQIKNINNYELRKEREKERYVKEKHISTKEIAMIVK